MKLTLFKFRKVPINLNLIFLILPMLMIISNGLPGLYYGIIILISIVFHEIGHVYIAQLFKYPVKEININLFFGEAVIEGEFYKHDQHSILIYSAGPLSNGILAGLSYFFLGFNSEIINYFFIINLILGISNLIPLFGLDGYRILESLFHITFKTHREAKNSIIFSGTISLLFSIGLLIMSFWFSFWILLIFSLLFLYASVKRLLELNDKK